MRDGCEKVILETTCLFRNSAGCLCLLHQSLAPDLCQFPFRNIAGDLRRTEDISLGISDWRNGKRNVYCPSILRLPHGLGAKVPRRDKPSRVLLTTATSEESTIAAKSEWSQLVLIPAGPSDGSRAGNSHSTRFATGGCVVMCHCQYSRDAILQDRIVAMLSLRRDRFPAWAPFRC